MRLSNFRQTGRRKHTRIESRSTILPILGLGVFSKIWYFAGKKTLSLKKPQANIGKNACMHMSLFYRKLKAISDVQDTLNHFDVIASVIEHLNCPQDDVVRETLAFLCMLLYNGNENVQVLFIHKCWQRLIAKWKTLAKFRGFLWVHLWFFVQVFV